MRIREFYLAIVIDAAALFTSLAMSTQPAALPALLGMHGLASAMLALSLFPVLPKNYRRQKTGALLLLFALAFMAPVAGPIAVALILRSSFPRDDMAERALRTVGLPEFDPRAKDAARAAQGSIRSRLAKHVPEPLRLQSLLTLQAVPDPVANPILEALLSDDADDIRLVAFGMLDAREKALSRQIQRSRARLDAARNGKQRYEALRNLADLHWEMVYAGLVQGGLRLHILETAWSYVQSAKEHSEAAQDAPLALLEGRILMAMERPAEAQAAFERSLQLGQPAASVLPYLAELAFLRRDHAGVRRLMQELSFHQLAPRVRNLVDLWSGRHSSQAFRDRRVLPHL